MLKLLLDLTVHEGAHLKSQRHWAVNVTAAAHKAENSLNNLARFGLQKHPRAGDEAET